MILTSQNNNFIYKTKNTTPVRCNNVSFGKSQVNIVATSDNHGTTATLPEYYHLILTKMSELFGKKNKQTPKSIANVAVFNGDWFMNPKPKGYLSKRTLTNGDVQFILLRSFVNLFKAEDKNCHVLFNMGNHDLDGGAKQLFKYLKASGTTTILTNTDIKTSKLFKELHIKANTANKKFVPEYIIEVKDDKNPKLTNKVLFLGITTPAMENYIPEGIETLDIADKKKENKDYYPETIKSVNERINKFKTKNPGGSVVLLTHTGAKVAKNIASKVDIAPDLILNGHDHKDEETIFNANGQEIKMISLSENNQKVDSIKLHFDDNGKLENITTNKFYRSEANAEKQENITTKKTKKILKKDLTPYIYIESDVPLKIDGVRHSNNHLANFINDNILEAINKTDEGKGTQLFCIPSTAFRKDINHNDWSTNSDILNLLNGNIENISRVYTGKAAGEDVVSMVLENMILHKEDEFKNTILQWAGLRLNKTLLIEIISNLDLNTQADLTDQKRTECLKQVIETNAIEIKDKNGNYQPVNLKQEYKLAMPNYFFVKNRVPTATDLGTRTDSTFKPLNKTMIELFKDNITSKVTVKPEVRIKI